MRLICDKFTAIPKLPQQRLVMNPLNGGKQLLKIFLAGRQRFGPEPELSYKTGSEQPEPELDHRSISLRTVVLALPPIYLAFVTIVECYVTVPNRDLEPK